MPEKVVSPQHCGARRKKKKSEYLLDVAREGMPLFLHLSAGLRPRIKKITHKGTSPRTQFPSIKKARISITVS